MPADSIMKINPENQKYFDLFNQVGRIRNGGMSGPEPLQPTQIIDWCVFTSTILDSHERQLLLDMDSTFRIVWREENVKLQAALKLRSKNEKKYD